MGIADSPLAAIANSIMIFVTFLLAIPGMLMPVSRGWLKAHGAMVVVCGIFSLVIGLEIWFETLKTRENLSLLWNKQPSSVQSLLQQEVCPKSCFFPATHHVLTYTPTAQLLWIPQLHLATFHPGHGLPQPPSRRRKGRMREAILLVWK